MDILSYIQRINQLYGSEQQVAGLSESFPGTFTSYNDAVSEGFQGSKEEWLQQQSIPQIDRPFTGQAGGRVYDTRKYFKPGGLVEPGVTHYGTKKSPYYTPVGGGTEPQPPGQAYAKKMYKRKSKYKSCMC